MRNQRETIKGLSGYQKGDETSVFQRLSKGWRRWYLGVMYIQPERAEILLRYVTLNKGHRNPAYLVRILTGPCKGKEVRVQ